MRVCNWYVTSIAAIAVGLGCGEAATPRAGDNCSNPPCTGSVTPPIATGGNSGATAGNAGLGSAIAGTSSPTGAAGTPAISPPPRATGGMVSPPPLGVAGSSPPVAAAGAGGTPATAGSGGSTAPIDMPAPESSAGCGKTDSPKSDRYTIDVMGMSREYIVKVPDGYDAKKPYRLIFAWHYLGGNAQGIATGFGGGYYGLESRAAGSAIFVAPEGIDAAWPNTGGRDVNFAKAMVEWMRSNYCVDNKRIFSVGFSYGAIMSNTVGCQMGDVFRAIAPMSGSGPLAFGGTSCKGPVAAWMSHGQSDTTVPFASGQASRDHWVMANGCQTSSKPADPSPCVAYDGCMAGYPVVWCEFPGTHQQPSFGPDAIWKFFSQF